MPQLFLNNFQTQFIASVKAAPDSASPALELDYGVLRVSDGAAGVLLNPAAGNWYVLTAFKRSGSAETDYEVMHVTAVDNAVLGECRLTVMRGQEGTTPKTYAAGDILELRLTAGGMNQYVQTTDARMSNARAPAGPAGGVLSGVYPNPGFAQPMATMAELGGKVDKVAGKVLSANDFTNDERVKLANVAEQATKNALDSQLRDRSTHTGTQAISTVTGLQVELDGKIRGDNVKTVNGQSILGSGNITAGGGTEKKFYLHTANTTLTVPAGVSVVRFYAMGRGGSGGYLSSASGGATGGGGGGFAFGDISVVEGDQIELQMTYGEVVVKLNSVTVGTALRGESGNTGTTGVILGGAGGAASITSAVTNGGAYSGGPGGKCTVSIATSKMTTGGGSCGSPLGDGFPGGECLTGAANSYSASGGGGIGGAGGNGGIGNTTVGGGGAGEPGGSNRPGGAATGGSSRGVLNCFTDPLLRNAIFGRYNLGCPGVGGYFDNAGISYPAGDFGGGGANKSTTALGSAQAGGLLGGAGGGMGFARGEAGYGGGGGGGVGTSVSTANLTPWGCFLYY